jgi:membrane protease YdiL (CAAX protease family)
VFGTAAAVIAVALLAFAVLVEPVWGWFAYRWLVARRDSDPRALVRVYRILLATQWAWTALVLLAVALSSGLDLAAIGVRAPRLDELVLAMTVSATIVLVVSSVALRAAARKGEPIRGLDAYAALLPRTREERRYATASAITAGVCEEVLYRGFFIAIGVGLFHFSLTTAAVLSVVVFLVAHIYQGRRGVIAVGVLAIIFTVLYVRSASLLFPIVLHALVDLRALLLVPPPPVGAGDRPRPGA